MFKFISIKRRCIKKKKVFLALAASVFFPCTEEAGMSQKVLKEENIFFFFLLRNIKNSKTSFPCSCCRICSRNFFQSGIDVFSPSYLFIGMLMETIINSLPSSFLSKLFDLLYPCQFSLLPQNLKQNQMKIMSVFVSYSLRNRKYKSIFNYLVTF